MNKYCLIKPISMSHVMEKAQLLLMVIRNPCELHKSPLHSARQQCGVANICYHHQILTPLITNNVKH